eukprot:Colp12_sorted_trinity150504_noHs@16428
MADDNISWESSTESIDTFDDEPYVPQPGFECQDPHAPKPDNESDRLKALRAYFVLDTNPEDDYDRITRLATRLFKVEISLVSFIDEERQWFKSCIGMKDKQGDRKDAFCSHVVASRTDDVMVVPNAKKDPRFKENPLVTGRDHVRFYAGAPLITPDGYKLGTLCILDRKKRKMTEEEKANLVDLAAIVVQKLELRILNMAVNADYESLKTENEGLTQEYQLMKIKATKVSRDSQLLHNRGQLVARQTRKMCRELESVLRDQDFLLQSLANCSSVALMVSASKPPKYALVLVNQAWCQLTGYSKEEVLNEADFLLLTGADSAPEAIVRIGEVIQSKQQDAAVDMQCYRRDGSGFAAELLFKHVVNDKGNVSHHICFVRPY